MNNTQKNFFFCIFVLIPCVFIKYLYIYYICNVYILFCFFYVTWQVLLSDMRNKGKIVGSLLNKPINYYLCNKYLVLKNNLNNKKISFVHSVRNKNKDH